MKILARYFSSMLQDFESYLRIEVDLVEDDIRLILDENKSNFLNFELLPGFYTFKNISQVLSRNFQLVFDASSKAINIEFNDISMESKLNARPDLIAIKFDENHFSVLPWVSMLIGIINTIKMH